MKIYLKTILFYLAFFSIYSLFSLETDEKLTFDVKYGIITAGEAFLQIEQTTYKDSIPVLRIHSLAKTNSFFDKIYKVRDYFESIWSMKKEALRFTKKLREGKYWQHRVHFYYPKQNLSVYVKFGKKTKNIKQKKMEIPPQTQDILSAFYWLRNQNIEVGQEYIINVTADGLNYPAKVIVRKKEKIKTIFGKKNCFVVEPMLEGDAIFKQTGKILIWLTADEKKIPVKMSSKIIFGSFKAILKKVEYGLHK